MSFENLNLHPDILRAIVDSGYTTPTPIQKQAIPEVLKGKDLLGFMQVKEQVQEIFIFMTLF